jgi:hypothetical protein
LVDLCFLQSAAVVSVDYFPFGKDIQAGDTGLSALWGVSEAGLNTIVLPAIKAGNIFQVGIATGKFQGVMQATTLPPA